MKKILGIMLALTLLFALTACGGSGGGGDDSGVKTLVMATNAEFPPYEYYENDEIVGIDAEIAKAIADKLGMELRIDDMAFDATLVALQSGMADVILAGMTVTPERLENVNFSDSYAESHQVIIVTEDSDITGPDSLNGKQIGVQTNTTGDIYATEDYGDEAVKRYNRGADAVLALSQGLIDAVIIDREPARSFVAANQGLKILDTEYAVENYAIAVAKENTDLLEQINTALKELQEDGTLQEIIDRYIPAE